MADIAKPTDAHLTEARRRLHERYRETDEEIVADLIDRVFTPVLASEIAAREAAEAKARAWDRLYDEAARCLKYEGVDVNDMDRIMSEEENHKRRT